MAVRGVLDQFFQLSQCLRRVVPKLDLRLRESLGGGFKVQLLLFALVLVVGGQSVDLAFVAFASRSRPLGSRLIIGFMSDRRGKVAPTGGLGRRMDGVLLVPCVHGPGLLLVDLLLMEGSDERP